AALSMAPAVASPTMMARPVRFSASTIGSQVLAVLLLVRTYTLPWKASLRGYSTRCLPSEVFSAARNASVVRSCAIGRAVNASGAGGLLTLLAHLFVTK